MIGILAVVASLALIVSYRSSSLRGKCRDYQQLEESLDAELKEEELRAAELSKKKDYVKTREYIIEKAREIFGLKMPDEIIVKPEN